MFCIPITVRQHLAKEKAEEIIELLNSRSDIIHLDLVKYSMNSDWYPLVLDNIPPTIRYLSFSYNMHHIESKDVRIILHMLSSNLQRIQVTNVKHLFLDMDNFERVHWDNANTASLLNNDFATAINTMLLSSSIESLAIRAGSTYRYSVAMNFLANFIKNTTHLLVLNVRKCGNNISLEQISTLLRSVRNTQIRELHFEFQSSPIRSSNHIASDHNCVSTDLIEFIDELEHNQIERVYINNRALNTDLLDKLFEMLPRTRVRDLALVVCEHIALDDALLKNNNAISNSSLAHLWIKIYNNVMPSLGLFTTKSSLQLKTKALSISFEQLPNPLSLCNDQLLEHLTHLSVSHCDLATLAQFEALMVQLTKSRTLRSLRLNIPMNNQFLDIITQYLPQCDCLIEFGYLLTNFSDINALYDDNKLVLPFRQSNIRYLITDGWVLEKLAPMLKYTKVIKIMTLDNFRLCNIVKYLADTQITEIVNSSLSHKYNGFLRQSLIKYHQLSVALQYNDCIFLRGEQVILHNNKLKVNAFLSDLDYILFGAEDEAIIFTNKYCLTDIIKMWGHIVEWFQYRTGIFDNDNVIWVDEFTAHFVKRLRDMLEAVDFLRLAEANNIKSLSISLLQHRPMFYLRNTVDDIMHPYVYILLHKYGFPLYHKNIEPGRRQKLINYFTTVHDDDDSFTNEESATVLSLLQ